MKNINKITTKKVFNDLNQFCYYDVTINGDTFSCKTLRDCIDMIGGVLLENINYCSKCDKEMTEGYCIDSGYRYFCSDECLNSKYTKEEIEELNIGGDNSDSYWTKWSN